jgi:hypothetical protein
MKIKLVISIVCFSSLVIGIGAFGAGKVVDTRHNLSVSGSGDIKSPTETRVCIFCHSSHNASSDGPLWNHKIAGQKTFQTYQRSTMHSRPEQPNGSTKLCLSCHDGTIAVGAVHNRTAVIPMSNVGSSGEIPVTRKSHIGTDLSGTHPVSVKFDQEVALTSSHLKWPPTTTRKSAAIDANGYVQCTSCHDPHDDSKSDKYPFWRSSTFGEVCKSCHEL